MPLARRTIGFIVFAIAVSLACLHLGVWQLARLQERRAHNAVVAQRRSLAPVPARELRGIADSLRYRSVTLDGRFDYEHEVLLSGRARGGSPGVYLATPVREAGRDTAVLVIRGWVYAPDGKSVDQARWHEADTVHLAGFVDTFAPAAGPVSVPGVPTAVRFADRDSIGTRLPFPIAPFLVTQTSDSAERPDHPARLVAPALTDGPHLSYAIQWFAFAVIAWVGVGAIVWKGRSALS
ncbi:MAG: SURF1 family protein [Gemmatimonadaceae bacterium]